MPRFPNDNLRGQLMSPLRFLRASFDGYSAREVSYFPPEEVSYSPKDNPSGKRFWFLSGGGGNFYISPSQAPIVYGMVATAMGLPPEPMISVKESLSIPADPLFQKTRAPKEVLEVKINCDACLYGRDQHGKVCKKCYGRGAFWNQAQELR